MCVDEFCSKWGRVMGRGTWVLVLVFWPVLCCGKDLVEKGIRCCRRQEEKLPEQRSYFEERDGTQCPSEGLACVGGVHWGQCIRQKRDSSVQRESPGVER